jgi:hypothetical protein
MKNALLTACAVLASAGALAAEANPFIGNWALTLPGGGAGWLGGTQEDGYLDASILWGGGSVVPVENVYVDGDTLVVTRTHEVKRKGTDRKHTLTETLTAKVDGDALQLTREKPNDNGVGVVREEFTGKRIPPVPAAPDLSQVKFGAPIPLFNGKDLAGWELTDASQANGWGAKDGLLVNETPDKKNKSYGNLRTVQEFEDFNLKLQVRVPEDGNSGIYLRGIYEVQVADTYGKPVDPHNMGAIYSRITPAVAAEKPAGEWQDFDITLVERHVTVKLNGKTIIDNRPLLGCTGGALWSDVFRPGPIYLQGDHTAVEYRNLVLTPVVK